MQPRELPCAPQAQNLAVILKMYMLTMLAFIKKWISILNPKSNTDNAFLEHTLQELLAGYVAVTDQPAIMFSGELASAFPDAKIICTVRDPERWWASMKDLAKTLTVWWLKLLFWPVPTLRFFAQFKDGLRSR